MAQVEGVFESSLQKSISDSKILVVGAGGIGCELLKNIVLTGKQPELKIKNFTNLSWQGSGTSR